MLKSLKTDKYISRSVHENNRFSQEEMMGKLYAVGFGPGGYEHMTAKAIDVIKK